MNIAEIKKCDIANGPGVRCSLFVSGCTHHCPGCFNEIAWDFAYGRPFDAAAQQELTDALAPDYIRGLTLLGGEPMEPVNQAALLPFLQHVKELCPSKDIWCYTGYLYEQDILGRFASDSVLPPHDPAVTRHLLSLIDVLVDGPFVSAEKDISLTFRGSRNQRIIDLKASLAAGKTILLPY